MRTDYFAGELLESHVAADPISQFARWFADAEQAKVPEVNAMTLATASADGVPSARIVLLKDFSEAGFTFFTNYDSHKGHDLTANPRAALVFFWQAMERQVRIEGSVQRVSREVSKAYFDSRPRASRIAASLSQQSEVVPLRKVLEDEFARLDQQLGHAVPLPDSWGGYCLSPTQVEFWQGRRSRLHDRLRYRREGSAWILERLSP
ncbi:pyridoxamine 5'-phosphate oxidase [soil metagenome]